MQKHLRPSCDPSIPHPGKIFYGGRWRTQESIERRREYQQLWSEKNPEHRREHQRRHYERHREKKLELTREYQARQIAEGLCQRGCGRSLATKTLCNKCADKRITPEQLLKARRRTALKRKAARHQTEPGE